MIKRIEVTEDLLKVIPIIFVQVKYNGISKDGDKTVFIDTSHIFNVGMHLLEDMAMALGIYDKAIKGTEDDPEGMAFPKEYTDYMLSLHKYVVDNIYYIESLIHQFVTKGGIQVGTYRAKDNELIWSLEPKNEEK